jgi:GNAT superfamily N-acetyltransferase
MADSAASEQTQGIRVCAHPDPGDAATGPVVRRANADELDAVAALFAPGLAPYRGTDADPLLDAYLVDLEDIQPRFEVAEVYLALDGGRAVGSVSFYPDVRLEGWSNFPAGWTGFRALVVHPDARGSGIGRALLETCIARTRAVGAPVLGLHTIELLADAVRLYERLGFVRCPEFDLRAVDVFPGSYSNAINGPAYKLELGAERSN